MHKTITVLTHNRPSLLARCLDALASCEGVSEWDVVIHVDGSDPSSRESLDETVKIAFRAAKPPLNADIRCWPYCVGTTPRTYAVLEDVFRRRKSDLNAHVEEDVLLAPDALRFIEYCSIRFDDRTQSVTLFSHPTKIPSEKDVIHRRQGFACHGWACSRLFYDLCVAPAPHEKSWTFTIFRQVERMDMTEFYPEFRRALDIGVDSGINPRSKTISAAQRPDLWTGDALAPNPHPPFCGVCSPTTRCRKIRELDGART